MAGRRVTGRSIRGLSRKPTQASSTARARLNATSARVVAPNVTPTAKKKTSKKKKKR